MLKSDRIYLRPLEKTDLQARVNWVNDEEIRRTLMFDWPLSLSKTEKWFQNQLMDDTKRNFSIIDRETDRLIGMTGLIDISIRHSRAQFYLTIGDKDYWGKRIPDESIPLILEYAFLELGLNRVYLYTIDDNEKARKVYLRNGFQPEGTLREHYFCVGRLQDLHVYSIIRSHWANPK
jgi:RimJ/RimL family protein N-acetyltransferase